MAGSVERAWRVVAASVRGASHVRADLPNQDAVASLTTPTGVTVVALADGHGSPRSFRSDRGARLAVEVATMVVAELTEDGDGAVARLVADAPDTLVARWVAAVTTDLAADPLGPDDPVDSLGDNQLLAYGATLLVAVVIGPQVVLLQLGDGDVLTADPEGRVERPIAPDARLVGNETTSLCLPRAADDMRTRVLGDDGRIPALMVLATDGYANAFATDDGFLRVASDLLAYVRTDGIDALEQRLPDWLVEASVEGSGDDVTAAVVVGPHAIPVVERGATATGRSDHELSDVPADDTLTAPTHPAAAASRAGRSGRGDRRGWSLVVAFALVFVLGLGLGWGLRHVWPTAEVVCGPDDEPLPDVVTGTVADCPDPRS